MRSIKALGVVLLATLLFFGEYYALDSHFKAQISAMKPKEVQVIQYDTLTAYFPLEIEKKVILRDTIKIPVVDTLYRGDTLYLPREQKVYGDSTYKAYISGVQPRLDSIFTYQKTIEITKIATQKEWRKFNYGLQLGVGVVQPFNGNVSFGGYVGVGVGINF